MKIDISVYRGYINDKELIISGHIFESWAPSQYSIQKPAIQHAFSIFRMFTISPLKNAPITLKFKDVVVKTKSSNDGYFDFKIPYTEDLESGWHSCTILHKVGKFNMIVTGEILKPFTGMYNIISDIDDTFLISHSSNFLKKLLVMLTQNLDKRRVFDNVSNHYKALSIAGQENDNASNSFFYVSSSEWNLYSFIVAIAKKHDLPKAVIKLKKIKTGLLDFFQTGRGSHNHKFEKIKNIVSFYPKLQYVLLGDDSQKDPYIYKKVCELFPDKIKVVYIRQTEKIKKNAVTKLLHDLASNGTETFYYKDSKDAIIHSKKIQLIN